MPTPNYEVWQKGENNRAVYYGCGSDVTVTVAQSTNGPRAVCMTHRTNDCEHTRAVRKYIGLPAQEIKELTHAN